MPPSKANALLDILFLDERGELVRLPEIQEYPDLFPMDDRGFSLVSEHFKASLARSSNEDIEYLEENKFIIMKNINGSKMIYINYPEIGRACLSY
jgi:hypothetical protein